KELGWEETGWIAARNGRQALAIALTGMMRDGEITRERASQLAHMVLHDNAKELYGLETRKSASRTAFDRGFVAAARNAMNGLIALNECNTSAYIFGVVASCGGSST